MLLRKKLLRRSLNNFVVAFMFCFMISSTKGNCTQKSFSQKLNTPIPCWMQQQIQEDLSHFFNRTISIKQINNKFNEGGYFVKFTILNNKVSAESIHNEPIRIQAVKNALEKICEIMPMPNVVFLMSLHDGQQSGPAETPIFAMSKLKEASSIILLPDFEALRERYQVIEGKDITKAKFPWEKKYAQLIWRGSTAQHSSVKHSCDIMNDHNLHLFSRVKLCELSLQYPQLIDAKFTIFAQGGEKIPYLKNFAGNRISFQDQINYKYHLLIDGNSSAYSNSGWKFFINSVVFIEDSFLTQWYHKALKPYVHYIPVKENLTDLKEQLDWAKSHDAEAKNIAANGVEFAKTSLTVTDNFCYFYWLIQEYSKLHFVD